MLNPIHLRTLVTVIRSGSFADAARDLGYTSSAVSQQVASLERALRLPLFERGAQSITPTPIALSLAERANDVLGTLVMLEDEIAAIGAGQRGVLRLGSFATLSERLLPRWLAEHRRRFPQVDVRLDEGEPHELIPRVQLAELDIALVYRYDGVPVGWPAGLRQVPLLSEELFIIAPVNHRLAQADSVAMNELADERWISTTIATSCTRCLYALAAAHDFEPDIALRSDNYAVIGGLVASELGIALVPNLGYHRSSEVVRLRIDNPLPRRNIVLVHRTDQTNAVIKHGIDGISDAAAALMRNYAAG